MLWSDPGPRASPVPNAVTAVRGNSCHLLQSAARPGLSVQRREVSIACKITAHRGYFYPWEIRSRRSQSRCFMLIASLLTLHSVVLTATSPLATFILSSLCDRWHFYGMIHPTKISQNTSPAGNPDFLRLTAR